MCFRIFAIFSLAMVFQSQNFTQTVSNESPVKQSINSRSRSYLPIRKKPTGEQKRQLQPATKDLTEYAEFLAQPKTGIFRLLPELACNENKYVVNASPECLNQIPDSSYYSFREKEHTAEVLSDIRLESNHLISDGILSQGILVELGDVALNDVSLNSSGLEFLKNYVPQSLNREAHKQFLQMAQGVRMNNFFYRKALPVNINSTYAMRVIAYKGSAYQVFRGYRYDMLAGDKRIDLILTFRVIRKEPDNSITLLWKELERRESPRLKYVKKKNENKR